MDSIYRWGSFGKGGDQLMLDYGRVALANIAQLNKSMVLPELYGASPIASPTANRIAIQKSLDMGGYVRLESKGIIEIDEPLIISSDTYFALGGGVTLYLKDGVSKNVIKNRASTLTGVRDTNIVIEGGTFVRGSGSSTGGSVDTHAILIRNVDNVLVRQLSVGVKTGKYAVNLGNVTNFTASHLTFLDTSSDGVHINGPARDGRIHHIRGVTHDDTVAITANDYEAYADTVGDVSNIHIYDIEATGKAANIVKVLAGEGCAVDDIFVDNVRGSHAQHGVWIGDDNGYPSTDNGTHGSITVRDVITEGKNATSCTVYGNLANGAEKITLENVGIKGLSTNAVKIGLETSGVINELRVDDINSSGMSGRKAVRIEGTGTVNRLILNNPTMKVVGGNGGLLDIPSTHLGKIHITNPDLEADDTTSTNWFNIGEQASLQSSTISGGRIKGGRCVFHENADGEFTITGGTVISGVNRVANSYLKQSTYKLGEVTVTDALNPLFMVNSTAPGINIIGGDGTVTPNNPPLVARSGTQTMRVKGVNLKADINGLTGSLGDIVTTSVAQGSIPAGHPVISDGAGVWKSLISGSTWTKA